MTPDATYHNPYPAYLRGLITRAGIPLYEVARLLGHSAITTTQRYAHLAPDHLRAAVDALSTPATSCRTSTG